MKHPQLAYDPQGVAQLSAVLQQPNGLTWLAGGSHNCSFVLHALGHSFQRSDRKHRAPVGISLHPPGAMVPLRKLIYLQPLQAERQQKSAAQHAWASIRNSSAPLLLLDAIPPSWLREDFLPLARTRRVIITGEPDAGLLGRARAKGIAMFVVKVSALPTVQAPITVRVSRIEL